MKEKPFIGSNSNRGKAGVADVIAKVCNAAFGKPLVTNVLRGQVVEAIVALALEPEWTWCSADYASWDFENAQNIRLEVKQSACRQTWHTSSHFKVSPGFDVKARKLHWIDDAYVESNERSADVYILAYHGQRDVTADHRDPQQWEFFVIPSSAIPKVGRIGLPSVRRIADSVKFEGLADQVRRVATVCK